MLKFLIAISVVSYPDNNATIRFITFKIVKNIMLLTFIKLFATYCICIRSAIWNWSVDHCYPTYCKSVLKIWITKSNKYAWKLCAMLLDFHRYIVFSSHQVNRPEEINYLKDVLVCLFWKLFDMRQRESSVLGFPRYNRCCSRQEGGRLGSPASLCVWNDISCSSACMRCSYRIQCLSGASLLLSSSRVKNTLGGLAGRDTGSHLYSTSCAGGSRRQS